MVDFLNKYCPIKVLAEGSYGQVLLAKYLNRDADAMVAIKIFNFKDGLDKRIRDKNPLIKKSKTKSSKDIQDEIPKNSSKSLSDSTINKMSPESFKAHGMKKHFQNEVQFLKFLSHRNIIKIIETANLIQMQDPLHCLVDNF